MLNFQRKAIGTAVNKDKVKAARSYTWPVLS